MAPKKNQKRRSIGTVVRSTRRVETIEVSVMEAGDTQESTQNVFTEEIFAEEPTVRRNIPVEEDGKEGEKTEIPVEDGELGEKTETPVEDYGEVVGEEESTEIPVGKEEMKKEEVPKEGKMKMKTGGERRKKRKRSKGVNSAEESNFKVYVFRVLKQVHPDLRISGMGMSIINSLMKDMFERIADEAGKLSEYTRRMTLSSREIQDAVKLVLPGELGRHAIAEGSKAVTNYMTYNLNK
ncbi:uncharacterized protein [Euphorbia lathyris]|uniref:uncharacterized protein n=1 Tax=Euphorbia lathyris TaxID=212925 RepID=UPI003314229F